MTDRIKLAEAMGWEPTSIYTSASGKRDVTRWRSPSGKPNREVRHLPDPEHDANDDYTVLEWMREKYDPEIVAVAFEHIGCGHAWAYEIGIYAEAALAIINDDIKNCLDCCAQLRASKQ